MRPRQKPGGKANDGKANDGSAQGASASSSLNCVRASTQTSGGDNQSTAPATRGKAVPTSFAPGLYVVATPIGNARDITLRALDLLRAADIIACEDTRVTRKLFIIHDIDRPTLAYHDHNAARIRPRLMERLIKGEIVALVSDAGTPLISDPGYRLVNEARQAGVAVTALPGASAPLAALASAGLPTDKFLFAGFLPAKSAARRRALGELASVPATLVFFESATRLAASLTDMTAELGPREAAVLRELTKKFEEARHGSLPDLARHYQTEGPPKGEIVVLVAPPDSRAVTLDEAEIDAMLLTALDQSSVKDAAAAVAERTSLPRRALYNRALVLRTGVADDLLSRAEDE
ncbi:MAG: 16S rRNA (cytidine(1402)-2'-O)-methyltransferase [Alphaproteobacteria bacterium]|nr:16S rRNA (cytidine(1402)-2'-O)-methyltransferase [Alphaproteobacteria bacterium]